MPRAQKGERNGGRQKGSLNKATIERLERERIARQAQQEVDKARQANTKLGKDVLEEFMKVFAGMAATYQPAPPGAPAKKYENEDKFLTYAKLAVETARDLAAFQSPKFKAIAVMAPPPTPVPNAKTPMIQDGKAIDDPAALSRFYQNFMKTVETT